MEAARPALPDDHAACARLLEEARDQARGLRGGQELLATCSLAPVPLSVDEQWVAEHCIGAQRVLLVGTIADVVVGVGTGGVTMRGAEQVGTVECCYVESAARGVGVGSALADALLGWFAARGCAAVDAPALPGDRSMKQLFESQGLSARALILHRRLR
ncbi:MAG: GNAT family N-acetyltransferase [Acidimicrobiales bacterium]